MDRVLILGAIVDRVLILGACGLDSNLSVRSWISCCVSA